MLFGTFGVLLGYQTLWLWAFARIFGWTSGILPENTFSPSVFRQLNLERGLIAGVVLLVAGLAMNLWLFVLASGTATPRHALWGFTAMVLGAQTIYGSFFLSMLGMAKERRGNSA
jgi:hypothetical protein